MAEDDLQSSPQVSTEVSLSSLRSRVSEFSDSHDAWLSKQDFVKKVDKMSEWAEEQKKSSKDKSIKEGVENVCKIATSTANAIQKFQSGEASDIVSGTMDIVSSVVTCAGEAVGGPIAAAVGAIIGTICNIIGAIFTANKPKQPSVVEQLAKVVHQELVDFNKKLQDQKYNGLVDRVTEQKTQLRTMERGDDLADPNLWHDYVQFMGELSSRFESSLPFKYEDNLTKDPDVADFVTAVGTYCQAYNCFMALLISAKGKFSHFKEGCWHLPFIKTKADEHMKMVDLVISSQMKAAKAKLAFLSDEKYLTFLGRLPYEGGKLTKIVALSRNSEARTKLESVTRGLGLPRLPDLETVESSAKNVSGMLVTCPYPSAADLKPGLNVQFTNKSKFPMKIVSATVGNLYNNLEFTEVVEPNSSIVKNPTGCFSVGGYIVLYLDGKVRSDKNPHDSDVTRVIEFALSWPRHGYRKINIRDKTSSEFTRGQDTYEKMQDAVKKTTYWLANDTHHMACGEIFHSVPYYVLWRFLVQEYDPSKDCASMPPKLPAHVGIRLRILLPYAPGHN